MNPTFIAGASGHAVPVRSAVARPYVTTASGVAFSLAAPTPAMVRARDIAHHLATIARYNGAASPPWSVAQHTDLVIRLCPHEAKTYAALHDAHEAYTGDFITPVKRRLADLGGGDALRRLVAPIDSAIHAAFDLPWPPPADIAREVARADRVALATEWRDFMPERSDPDLADPPAPAPLRLKAIPWPAAADLLHRRFKELFGPCPAMTK